jgi:hypothetical protein
LASWRWRFRGRRIACLLEMTTVRKVMLALLVLVVGGLLIYGAFMLADIAFSVSHTKP